jgi:hypothetical protein
LSLFDDSLIYDCMFYHTVLTESWKRKEVAFSSLCSTHLIFAYGRYSAVFLWFLKPPNYLFFSHLTI